MAKFIYNNTKNPSTDYIPFELNCGYHTRVSFEEDVDLCSRFRFTDKLVDELRELMEICFLNLLYAQDLQKRAHNKGVKSCSYIMGDKI